MIFALATDEQTLFVFQSTEEAIAYCEGVDVEAGDWIFWDEGGSPLQAEFTTPNHHGRFSIGNGAYRLVPDPSGDALISLLGRFGGLEKNQFFASATALRDHLVGTARGTEHSA